MNPADKSAEAQSYWAQGTQFALETGKSLLLINGAAAAGILTFVGNHSTKSREVFCAMVIFSFGSLSATVFLGFAYNAQLYYGNSAIHPEAHQTAVKWHRRAYAVALFRWLIT